MNKLIVGILLFAIIVGVNASSVSNVKKVYGQLPNGVIRIPHPIEGVWKVEPLVGNTASSFVFTGNLNENTYKLEWKRPCNLNLEYGNAPIQIFVPTAKALGTGTGTCSGSGSGTWKADVTGKWVPGAAGTLTLTSSSGKESQFTIHVLQFSGSPSSPAGNVISIKAVASDESSGPGMFTLTRQS